MPKKVKNRTLNLSFCRSMFPKKDQKIKKSDLNISFFRSVLPKRDKKKTKNVRFLGSMLNYDVGENYQKKAISS